jgi:ABC-type uncharacterized transport system substrate-binding protein
VSKRLGLLHDMIPAATIIGLLLDAHDPRAEMQASDMRAASRPLGLQVHLVNASTEGEIDSAFAKLAQQRAGALFVGTGEFFTKRSEQIVALAARHALPAIYQYRLFAVIGGLATYGTSLTDSYRQAGIYTGRVLKGEKMAPLLGLELTPIGVSDIGEIGRALTAFVRAPNGGLIVTGSAPAAVRRDQIIALAAKHRLPAIYPYRFFVSAGGLISYGPDTIDQYRRAAGYVNRILNGESPADLPVQSPTKYDLAINLKTAKALGLEIPPSVLARADEVIE